MKVYLVPTVIAEDTEEKLITSQVRKVLDTASVFFVENVRTSRRYISKLSRLPGGTARKIDELVFELVDKNTTEPEIAKLFQIHKDQECIGILSESGCPGIADPGSLAVLYAHKNGHRVIPISGPSSIFLALMASGLNGQHFTFHGTYPFKKKNWKKKYQD